MDEDEDWDAPYSEWLKHASDISERDAGDEQIGTEEQILTLIRYAKHVLTLRPLVDQMQMGVEELKKEKRAHTLALESADELYKYTETDPLAPVNLRETLREYAHGVVEPRIANADFFLDSTKGRRVSPHRRSGADSASGMFMWAWIGSFGALPTVSVRSTYVAMLRSFLQQIEPEITAEGAKKLAATERKSGEAVLARGTIDSLEKLAARCRYLLEKSITGSIEAEQSTINVGLVTFHRNIADPPD